MAVGVRTKDLSRETEGVEAKQPLNARRERHHYPALDGLRGVAFVTVFLGHFYTIVNPRSVLDWGGWLGVDLFFVLSGFLITGILFDSLGGPHFFRTFYVRRTLRIFPLYYLPWMIFLVLTPWLHPLWNRFDLSRVLYFYNLMDFQAAKHPEMYPGGFMFHTLSGRLTGFNAGPLWSLSLEEQFYLVWPLVIFAVRRRERLMVLCAGGVVGSMVVNAVLESWATRTGTDRIFLYNATYAHLSPMLCGAFLALWMRGQATHRVVSAPVYLAVILVPGASLVLLLTMVVRVPNVTDPVIPVFGYLCSGLTSAGLVLATVQPGGPIKRALTFRPLMAIGTISYGMYILHGFLMSSFKHHREVFARHHVLGLLPVVAFGLVFVLASLSYRFYEQPFLRLKDRWAPSRPVAVTGRDPLAPMPGGLPGQ